MRTPFKCLLGLCFFSAFLFADIEVKLTPSDEAPAPVGTFVTWTAEAHDSDGGALWYRYRVRETGQTDFRVVRDFGPESGLFWAPVDHEADFEIEVSVRNLETGSTAETVAAYAVIPGTADGRPVVRLTLHPLVALYSAPPCRVGQTMRIAFSTAGVPSLNTPEKACDGVHTMNFYLAGLYAETRYNARQQTLSGGAVMATGAPLEFVTGPLPTSLARYSVTSGAAGSGVLLHSPLNSPIAATDLDGNVVWFYGYSLSFLTRAGKGGYFWGFLQNGGPDGQLVRKVDLAGVPLQETNAARVSEQLIARGERPITGFHHEVVPLPDDRILLLGTVAEPGEKWNYKDGPVLGDKIVVLDGDLNVVWTWDAWDHLDPIRNPPILRENCMNAGCPTEYANTSALDWMHSNSVQLTPDGNLLISIRHLDLLLKLDYANGSGAILWSLGKGGNFQLEPVNGVSWPWFSHQHDANFLDERTIILFDNGNTRVASGLSEQMNSRGQVLAIDERAMTAKLVSNFDLGAYSLALGSAQKLASGNYHFNIGFIPPFRSFSVEVNPAGGLLYRLDSSDAEYRTIRAADLYSGPK